MLYPDLHVLTNDGHWTMTFETHYAAAARSFCFVTTENGEQQDICNLTTMPCVQRSLCLVVAINDDRNTQLNFPKGVHSQTRGLLERCMATCGKAAGARVSRCDLVHERKHQLKKYEDTTNSFLKIWRTDPG